jgi:hypothetical protein
MKYSALPFHQMLIRDKRGHIHFYYCCYDKFILFKQHVIILEVEDIFKLVAQVRLLNREAGVSIGIH